MFENNGNGDIDIVITWVDNTPELQKEREKWLNKGGYSRPSDARYTDHEEMKYLLRSIEKHFPNYRNIYIIIKDDQFPKYLKHFSIHFSNLKYIIITIHYFI